MDRNTIVTATAIGAAFLAAAVVFDIPVIENAKKFISCLDGHGFGCK